MEESLRGEVRPAQMARVLCKASALLERTVEEELLLKRLQFLIYELRDYCGAALSPLDSLDGLVKFFFHHKQYTVASPDRHFFTDHLISTLISTRKADIEVLTMLFVLMAQEIGLPLQILALRPLRYVRLANSETVLDLAKQGMKLSPQDLIEVLQNNPRLQEFKSGHLNHHQLLVSYLTHLKECGPCAENPNLNLALLSHLIELCPNNISLYAERALIFRQLGQNTHALADLKRYFSFQDRESGPVQLVELLEELEFHGASL
jgi:regulator of sirC expression with transglutaminase-like and TPR domain